jgi:hypothetical protein
LTQSVFLSTFLKQIKIQNPNQPINQSTNPTNPTHQLTNSPTPPSMNEGDFIELIDGKEGELHEVLKVLPNNQLRVQNLISTTILTIDSDRAIAGGTLTKLREDKEWVSSN